MSKKLKLSNTPKITVIGAGIGGLTTAAILSRTGLDVTVLEAHIYPGGCSGTFLNQGFQFDAGATLAGGFYPGGPMDLLAQIAGISTWQGQLADHAMRVYLPDDNVIDRFGDERRWDVYRTEFGEASYAFWRWQEQTADSLWELALQLPPWPPQDAAKFINLISKGYTWIRSDFRNRLRPKLIRDAFSPLSSQLDSPTDKFRLFIDSQLLISAQTTSQFANALYGATALDLPRRGVAHLRGGIGIIANTLVNAIRQNGGLVYYRQEVSKISKTDRGSFLALTKRGDSFESDIVIVNLPPWNILNLVDFNLFPSLEKFSQKPVQGWGAFMLYLGVDEAVIPQDLPLHNQIVIREPLGEGNSVFLSISPKWDHGRAPDGYRAITVSTHTEVEPWWHLYQNNKIAYEARKTDYKNRILSAVGIALPGIRDAANIILPGTPVTFQRYTRRVSGLVGGFPQTSLFRGLSPKIDQKMWMVGDSIFPGQSTAAVFLGGLQVALQILDELGLEIGFAIRTDRSNHETQFLSDTISSF